MKELKKEQAKVEVNRKMAVADEVAARFTTDLVLQTSNFQLQTSNFIQSPNQSINKSINQQINK